MVYDYLKPVRAIMRGRATGANKEKTAIPNEKYSAALDWVRMHENNVASQ